MAMTTLATMTTTEFLSIFETRLSDTVDNLFLNAPPIISEAAHYAVFSGGKRIRPTLCFLTSSFCDLDENIAFRLGIAIELIHSYSLIHDDLPCMDNDDFRRGKPTVHKKFGETIAMLTGDALLNVAYEYLLCLCAENPDYVYAAQIIATQAGIKGMIGGQALEFTLKDPDFDDCVIVAQKKTGALLSACVQATSSFCLDAKKRNAIVAYGNIMGLCFQLTDDLIDSDKSESFSFVRFADKYELKKYLSDLKNKGATFLSAYGDQTTELISFLEAICARNH